jgi:hypothetical protein
MLKKLGLERNWIYEVVMETGGLHRAPMGIWTEDFDHFVVDIYKDSSTRKNLKGSGIGTIYFIEDPKYFVETDDIEYFAKANFKVVETLLGNPKRYVCKVLELDVLKEGEPINRAKGLFTEYLVERSRRKLNDAADKRYRHYKRVIKKVAPGSVYERLMRKGWRR